MEINTYQRNATYLNKFNKIKVLDCVRKYGPVSRAEVAKRVGLSAPTITRLVQGLIQEEQLIVDIGEGTSSGGRPPTLIRINSDINYLIGIDLGTTKIHGVLSNLDADILATCEVVTPVAEGFDSIMQETAGVIRRLMEQVDAKTGNLRGIGMGVAGLITLEDKTVAYSPDFQWENVDVLGALQPQFPVPITLDNVTRVMAHGELWYGIGRERKNFICINVGYGIGSGIIVNGEPFLGAEGMAGEFGHITLASDSDAVCACGNRGCLEALASGRAIAVAAQKALKEGEQSSLREMCAGHMETVDAALVVEAARHGDMVASRIFENAMKYLGIGIAGLITLFNPQAVVIGGGVSSNGDIFFDAVRESIELHTMRRMATDVPIVPAHFGDRAAVMGAVSLILGEVLSLKHEKGIAA
jgi:glucokinase-like ROK family protein